MATPRITVILLCLTVSVLMLSVPRSLQEAYERGGFYLFSREFISDIPARLTGPGKMRFIIQPLVAMLLGLRGGLADARAHRQRYLLALFVRGDRNELLKHGMASIANLLLVGILVDSIVQWLIFGVSYPGAALVVGPVLIVAPYLFARTVSNFPRVQGEDPSR